MAKLFTFISLVDSGSFKGKLIYAVTTDEEARGKKGTSWLADIPSSCELKIGRRLLPGQIIDGLKIT